MKLATVRTTFYSVEVFDQRGRNMQVEQKVWGRAILGMCSINNDKTSLPDVHSVEGIRNLKE